MVVSLKTTFLTSSYPLKELFTKVPMLTPFNKMGLPNEKIVTFWKLPIPLCCQLLSLPISRVMPFSLSLISLTVFRCTAYVHSHGPNQTKFTPRAQAYVFVGHPLHQRGYKCFHPSSRKYFVTMDVTFIEDCPFFPVSLLQRESVSEESNYMFPLESTCPTVVTLPKPSSHNTVLPTNQVP
ncbi:reverse transcriptase [Cucumis melo var. makuwa]|uniref:Reverse transcriptase n=1 Tax=Cucumis melo var. makuwa TaxID=1194695 RepID=A0A5A7UKV0_CUCMM|nr:reverse transcriptase [Cucumis melo var. makuwa]TYK12083.1 reverse transcriptase [Cucumis melo var. makuwa]